MEIDFQEYQLSSELRGHEEDVSNLFLFLDSTNSMFSFLVLDLICKQFVECPRETPNFDFNLVAI